MRNHEDAAAEIEEIGFQRADGVDVEIACRFVEEETIGAVASRRIRWSLWNSPPERLERGVENIVRGNRKRSKNRSAPRTVPSYSRMRSSASRMKFRTFTDPSIRPPV
jgi:hypothetical protein